MDDVRCTGQETALLYCPNNGIGIHNCGHGEDSSVRCQGTLIIWQFLLIINFYRIHMAEINTLLKSTINNMVNTIYKIFIII